MRKRWTANELSLLRQLMQAGHSYASAGRVLDKSYNSVRQKCRLEGIRSTGTRDVADLIPPPDVPTYDGALELEGDFIIVCDVHAPATDWLLASQAALIGQKYLVEPRRLLIVGDLMNYEAFSRYDALVALPSFEAEKGAAQFAVKLWLQSFDEVYLALGNHDYRWIRQFQGVFPEDTILDLLHALVSNDQRLTISIYPWMTVDTINGIWHFTHLMEYAQTPLMKARKKANKHKNRHVCVAHQHHLAMGLDESGRFVIADLPMLADDEKLAYVGLGDSTKPAMKRGFSMLRNGTLYQFSDNPAYTDWGFWLDG